MKNVSILIALFVISCSNTINAATSNWGMANKIIKSIKKTSFPNREYNILDFGAVPNSTELASEAINNAIIACNQNGGGVVIVPKGEFFDRSNYS